MSESFRASLDVSDQLDCGFPQDGADRLRAPGKTAASAARPPLPARARAPMAKGCWLTTVNATSWGPLGDSLQMAGGASTLAMAAQERHRLRRDLATQQKAVKDAGRRGVWSAATPSPTSASGTVGGVAALAPTSIQVAEGVVILNVYLRDGEGLSGNELGILWQLAQYLGQLEAEGHLWAVMSDCNVEPQVLDFGWITKLRAVARATSAPSCRQGGGSRIDYVTLAKSMSGLSNQSAQLDLGAITWPHWPVHLALCEAPGGARATVAAVSDDAGLQRIWDLLLMGIETQILASRDLVGEEHRRAPCRGAEGAAELEAPGRGGAAIAAVHDLLQKVENHGHWARLPVWARAPFQRGGGVFLGDDWQKSLKRIVAEGKKQEKLDVDAIVERELRPWGDIWNYRGLKQTRQPADAGVWDHLAPLERRAVRDVIRSFLWGTGVGQPGIPPRAPGGISDEAVGAMIAVFHVCEDMLQWPSGRPINVMVRPPKLDGGNRLLGPMPTPVRIWSRARRPITKAWGQAPPSDLTWGAGPGRSSSDSACDPNLAKEQAKLAGWDSAEAALDLWKACEMVTPGAQLHEARALEFPLRLTRMLLSTYRQPRTLAAFNAMSRAVVAWQESIAGRGHAISLLLVLTLRALRRAHAIAPTAQPRRLVDDATLAWAGPSAGHSKDLTSALSSSTVSAADLQLVMQPQGFNLGHELRGRKVIRTQEKRRLASLMDRRRLAMLRRAAGRRAAVLVATGLSPYADHGDGVAGLADRPLAQLLTLAVATAGAKAGCGTAAVMLLQKRVDYDPIHTATAPVVVRLARRIWEGIGPFAALTASWGSLAAVAKAGRLTWASAHGPLAAPWLSLERIGWSMQSAWALRPDIG
ncbi:unnamed protein product [Prorocentrum cordatum]|uniref:Uncharacterized protein n=1 Tax=Prorocentrum cordatum TaxID=2364126 RepID=A0ABN9T864_9DINO|nr:unnamed protein product [Polarella glacialis]